MGFQVEVLPSGKVFTVDEGETILQAALRSSVSLPYGCKSGTCGTCKSQVRQGQWRQGAHAAAALSEQEEAQGKVLVCCATPLSDLTLEARVLSGFGDVPVRKMPARIAKIERVSEDVAVVSLQLPAAERLQFRAGQYVEFILRDGTRRSYSMATAPHADERIQLHIRHLPGGRFTDMLFGATQPAIKERDLVRIEGPQGTFFLREDDDRPIVLLASGTGFAPVKAIAEHIFHQGINREVPGRAARAVRLYWGGRRPKDLYWDALPRQWAQTQPLFTYIPVLSEPKPEDHWEGRRGFVHEAVMSDLPDLSGYQVYACGAPAMVQAAQRDFVDRCALSPEAFFSDAFTSEADKAQTIASHTHGQ